MDLLGEKLSPSQVEDILKSTGDTINDGDDEDDSDSISEDTASPPSNGVGLALFTIFLILLLSAPQMTWKFFQ